MKKYEIIYADPPWKISYYPRENRKKMKWENYQLMKFEDIKKMPIKNMGSDNSVLFLWSTNTFLPKALELIKEWGYKYHCTITWKKDNGITMRGMHRTTEFMLFCYKGKFPNIGSGKAFPCHVEHKRGKHSEKPNLFRKLIIEKFGDLPRLELFAREKREGFDVFGNEVENSIDLSEYYT